MSRLSRSVSSSSLRHGKALAAEPGMMPRGWPEVLAFKRPNQKLKNNPMHSSGDIESIRNFSVAAKQRLLGHGLTRAAHRYRDCASRCAVRI
ncbi:hypothetical protein [Bradyrhizobium sp. 1]|uniref:hypothetical protein n=1 Tax=Bradyrhizobium sp. 1 TaxID=241591 RepID=UPI001FF9133E|nr:hypothetical protein [Bradyrhizobium sp. 1]MCK1396501.1 hypothetical protein [Bradyrhizobium sp. 1]